MSGERGTMVDTWSKHVGCAYHLVGRDLFLSGLSSIEDWGVEVGRDEVFGWFRANLINNLTVDHDPFLSVDSQA